MAERRTSKKQPAKTPSASKDSSVGKEQDKAKEQVQNSQKKKGCFSYLLYFILFIVLISALAGGVIAAANYLGFIDVQAIKDDIGRKYELEKYPVIGQYFPPLDTNFEVVPVENTDEESSPTATQQPAEANAPASPLTTAVSTPDEANTNIITPEDVALEEERNQAEFAKRVARLSRLYGEMKPANAAIVMRELDDETVLAIFSRMEDDQVAKILSIFEAERAARLTEDMLRGRSY